MSRISRLTRMTRALRADRAQAAAELLPPEQLAAQQRDRLRSLVAHAVAHSPFYRDLYAAHGVGPDDPLEALPVLDKTTVMAAWDDVPADRRLRLSDARAALAAGTNELHGHQLFQTGGSTGEPGLFPYDAAATGRLMANALRALRYAGVGPRLPDRVRMSMIWAPGVQHMAARVSGMLDVGIYRVQRLAASAPIPELAAALTAHDPEVISGYPSTIGLLATAQLDGELDIHPRVVVASAEPLTDETRRRIRAAWGCDPFDLYATTETGPVAAECQAHAGRHVYLDAAILEPDGDRVLVTNLFNRAFPLVRFVVEDLVVADPRPCSCGRSALRLTAIAGRSNEVIDLPAAAGGADVSVHPSAWTPLTALEAVADAEVVRVPRGLVVRAVPRPGRDDTEAAVRRYVEHKLAELGVGGLELCVETIDELPRSAAGKRMLVRRAAVDDAGALLPVTPAS